MDIALFIEKSRQVHGDKFDYSQVVYKNNKTKVTIICPVHGAFEQVPQTHYSSKAGCRLCGLEGNRQSKTTPEDVVIQQARDTHPGKYDYSKVVYKDKQTPVIISCNTCKAEFKQPLNSHINAKQGCPSCGKEASVAARRSSTEEFISAALEIHNGIYSYEKTNYQTSDRKVIITCKEHGDFEQRPNQHLKGQGCKKCGVIRRSTNSLIPTEEFIRRAKDTHGDTYDYSKTEYTGAGNNVIVTCAKHGDFSILPSDHTRGGRCQRCSDASSAAIRTKPLGMFIAQANLIHRGKYGYGSTVYINNKHKSTYTCPVHGEFKQSPNSHLRGVGCPLCATPKGEELMAEFLNTMGTQIIRNGREVLQGYELDFYLPEYNLAIELNGLYWHSSAMEMERGRNWVINHQLNKQKQCKEKGVRLLHYYEDEWRLRPRIVKHQILHILNIFGKGEYARNTCVKPVPYQEAKDFFNYTHLQGFPSRSSVIGLYSKHSLELLAAMAFSPVQSSRGVKADGKNYELTRFSSKVTVTGGASKLLSAFIRDTPDWESIVSYSDNRWASGNLYDVLGFENQGSSNPDYQYVFRDRRVHKSQFKRELLAKRFPEQFDPSQSEKENCRKLNIPHIYNCGLTKWVKTNNKG